MKVILGTFIFSMETAYFTELRKSASQRIASQSGYLIKPTHHDLGPNSDQMTVPCKIFPGKDSHAGSIETLKDMMRAGVAYQLIGLRGATGELQGQWRIESINETHREFNAVNQAEVIEFDLSLLESQ